jgi:queuosine precursor transporter
MIVELSLIIFSLVMVAIAAIVSKKQGPEFMISMFVACIVLAAILGSKLFQIGPFVVDGTIVIFSITFLLTDMLSEFYGKKYAMKAVWGGFIGLILAIVAIQLTIHLQPASFWHNQEAFVTILGSSWRIMLASIIAYVTTQHFDVWYYDAIKKFTKNKHLWLRNNLSTATSQLLNTLIFSTIAFTGIAPLLPLITGSYIVKLGIAIMDTPIIYIVRIYFRK